MRNIRCWLVVLCLTTLASLLGVTACTDEPAKKNAGDAASPDRIGLCKQGGATLNAATNECLCPEGQAWNGAQCESAGPKAVAEALVPLEKDEGQHGKGEHGKTSDADEEEREEGARAEQAPGHKKAAAGPDSERLKEVCDEAHANWLADENYCACPDRKVLVGNHCRKLGGRMIDDVCLRAVHPGKWVDGGCDCPGDTVFNVARGGCVMPVLADQTLKISCESTLNNGHWDGGNVRCNCPKGRVWVDELCQVQQLLASQNICEGAFNKGKWDLEKKRCKCPASTIWINQTCQSPKGLSPKQVCESEGNGGKWNGMRHACICPRGSRWRANTHTCR